MVPARECQFHRRLLGILLSIFRSGEGIIIKISLAKEYEERNGVRSSAQLWQNGCVRRRLDFLSYAHLCSAAFNFDGHAEHVGYRERRSSLKGLSIYVTIECYFYRLLGILLSIFRSREIILLSLAAVKEYEERNGVRSGAPQLWLWTMCYPLETRFLLSPMPTSVRLSFHFDRGAC